MTQPHVTHLQGSTSHQRGMEEASESKDAAMVVSPGSEPNEQPGQGEFEHLEKISGQFPDCAGAVV